MPRVVAIDLGTAAIKVALVETSMRGSQVVDLFCQPLAPGTEPARELKKLLKEKIGAFDLALSAVSGEFVSHRFLDLPFSDHRRLEQTVPFELEAHLPFDLEGQLVTFALLRPQRNGGSSVLAALTPVDNIRAHLALLAQASVDPVAVDLASLAAANLLLRLAGRSSGEQALVDLNGNRLLLALVREGHLAGLRTLTIAATSGPEEIARDIGWSLLALSRGQLPQLARLWLGSSGGKEQLDRALVSQLGIFVSTLDNSHIPLVPAHLRSRQTEFVVPLGLALRHDSHSKNLSLNFRQRELAYHGKQEELWSRIWRLGILSATALLLLSSLWAFETRQEQRRLTALKTEIRQAFGKALPSVGRVVNERAQLEAAVAELERKRQLFGSVLDSTPKVIDLLRAMTLSVPKTAELDVAELTIDGGTVKLSGSVPSFEAVDAVKNAFASVPLFAQVSVRDVKASVDGKSVNFRLAMTVKGAHGDHQP